MRIPCVLIAGLALTACPKPEPDPQETEAVETDTVEPPDTDETDVPETDVPPTEGHTASLSLTAGGGIGSNSTHTLVLVAGEPTAGRTQSNGHYTLTLGIGTRLLAP